MLRTETKHPNFHALMLKNSWFNQVGFKLSSTQFSEATRHVVFYYTASWCPNCKVMTKQLKKVYRSLKEEMPELEIVTVTIDATVAERAQYLSRHRVPWPAMHPKAWESKQWKVEFPNGIPAFQAFQLEGDGMIVLTNPSNLGELLKTLKAKK